MTQYVCEKLSELFQGPFNQCKLAHCVQCLSKIPTRTETIAIILRRRACKKHTLLSHQSYESNSLG